MSRRSRKGIRARGYVKRLRSLDTAHRKMRRSIERREQRREAGRYVW